MGWLVVLAQTYPTALIGALGSLGSALTLLSTKAWGWWRESRKMTIAEQVLIRIEAQELLQAIPDVSPALRALLIRLSNGGSAMTADGPLYATIHLEARDPVCKAIRREWQRREIDATYRAEVLAPIVAGAQTLTLSTDAMEHSPLRDQYLLDGVRSTSVVVLHREKDGSSLWYLAVHHPVLASQIMDPAADESSMIIRTTVAATASRLIPLVRRLQ